MGGRSPLTDHTAKGRATSKSSTSTERKQTMTTREPIEMSTTQCNIKIDRNDDSSVTRRIDTGQFRYDVSDTHFGEGIIITIVTAVQQRCYSSRRSCRNIYHGFPAMVHPIECNSIPRLFNCLVFSLFYNQRHSNLRYRTKPYHLLYRNFSTILYYTVLAMLPIGPP